MKKYDYKLHTVPRDPVEFEKTLISLGEHGWEFTYKHSRYLYLFKREK